MLLTIEKVLVLKTLSIFAATPDDDLARVAAVVEEVAVKAGDLIIEKGAAGECMYVIAEGTVRMHDGERTIAELGARNVVGELGALDPEPRSASVTALSDALLFRLDREALYEVMAEDIEVAKGIIHVLCHRLRGVLFNTAQGDVPLPPLGTGNDA